MKRLFKKIEIECEATHLEKVQKVVPRNSRIIPSSSEVVEMGGTLSRRMAGIQAGNKSTLEQECRLWTEKLGRLWASWKNLKRKKELIFQNTSKKNEDYMRCLGC